MEIDGEREEVYDELDSSDGKPKTKVRQALMRKELPENRISDDKIISSGKKVSVEDIVDSQSHDITSNYEVNDEDLTIEVDEARIENEKNQEKIQQIISHLEEEELDKKSMWKINYCVLCQVMMMGLYIWLIYVIVLKLVESDFQDVSQFLLFTFDIPISQDLESNIISPLISLCFNIGCVSWLICVISRFIFNPPLYYSQSSWIHFIKNWFCKIDPLLLLNLKIGWI